MLKHFYILVTLLFVASTTSAFASSCYSLEEAEAEQGIRIHSELMVIGLNCQHMKFKDGTNLYLEYRKFTNEHADIFSTYEQTLMDYYQSQGHADPEAKINTIRTQIANKISKDAATMRPDLFCNRYASRLLKVINFSKTEIRAWAATFYDTHPVSNPICEH
jgi:hypothetical protein